VDFSRDFNQNDYCITKWSVILYAVKQNTCDALRTG